MTAVVEINKLETELKELQKKRGEVEYRLKSLEKAQQGLLGKRNRTDNSNLQNKRFKDNEDNGGKEEVKSGSREEFRPSLSSRIISDRDRDREPINKPTNRLSSVVTGQRSRDVRELKDSRESRDFRAPRESKDSRDSRDPRDSRPPRDSFSSRTNREETRKPKLTSAIVSPTPIPVVGEKPRPSLDTSSEETKKRSRNMFGVLVGTLKSFKNDISKKSEAEQRREEIEQKVHSKVKEEEQTFKEEQRRLLQEQKDKELSLREEIRQQQEQKELELLNLKWDNHRTQLSVFLKTEAKPPIFYKPIKVDNEVVKKEEQKGSSSSSENNQRTATEENKKEEQEEEK